MQVVNVIYNISDCSVTSYKRMLFSAYPFLVEPQYKVNVMKLWESGKLLRSAKHIYIDERNMSKEIVKQIMIDFPNAHIVWIDITSKCNGKSTKLSNVNMKQ